MSVSMSKKSPVALTPLMFSPQTPFSDDEQAKLEEWLDLVYEDFTKKVALARHMTPEAVHEIARGRVWTGADALERGLVDELGGLRRAFEIARDRAGLPPEAPLRPVPVVPPLQRLRRGAQQRRSGCLRASPDVGRRPRRVGRTRPPRTGPRPAASGAAPVDRRAAALGPLGAFESSG